MTELVKQGIDKANEDLRKENEQKMMQQGILRQIPVVGDFFNWFAPTEQVNIVGRTFDLQSGMFFSHNIGFVKPILFIIS